MKEIEQSEFAGCLSINHVMWYYDPHLQHRKVQDFTPVFGFVDHVPTMACKIAAIEPDTRMYLIGVSADRAAHWDDQVQKKLKHILTHGGHLNQSGDGDQQANWSNRGIPLWVTDDNYGQALCDMKGEEPVENGQAEPAQTPSAKRKVTGQ